MRIKLTQGLYAEIDDDDYHLVKDYKWYANVMANGTAYAATTYLRERIYMHKLLLGTKERVDHKDGNSLNNCRSNLRVCTQQQNSANAKKKNGASSKYKGVYFEKLIGKFRAQITHNYRVIKLGSFESEEEAARAYDEAAKERFGEFAKTNF